MTARAGTKVDHIVGSPDGLFIVFDDEHGVAEVAQVFERCKKTPVVAMVQADGRFVEDVEDTAQLRSDLRRQADALAFSTGECGGGTAKLEVAESDVVQEFEAFGDFVRDAAGDGQFPAGEFDVARTFESTRNRQAGEIGNRHAVHFDRQAFRTQTLAVAHRTFGRRHEIEQIFAIGFGSGGVEILPEVTENPQKPCLAPRCGSPYSRRL